jgi:murein DD-endopeptidase MepM/ murein hydrolase activator NlpD
VTKSGWSESEGWNVKVKHHDGFVTSYLHMLQVPEVIVGDIVYRGQLLGYLGSTGKSTGNHLHFAVHDSDGASIDPVDYLNSETAPTRTMMAKAETVVKAAGSRSYIGAGAMLLVVVAAIYFSEKS